jgi:hypothetical protein
MQARKTNKMDASDKNNQEKLQELAIIITDQVHRINKWWWYSLGITFVLCFPLFFGLRAGITSMMVSQHKFPAYIHEEENKVPLEVTEKKIFKFTNNSYGAYFKIRNSVNLEWGVISQPYTAVFYTTGGTEVTRITSNVFVLPSSERTVVISRFSADREPTMLSVNLGPTEFVRKPNRTDPKFEIQRTEVSMVNGNLTVAAGVKNNTPFTVSRVDLYVLLYDRNNQVVAANYTNIDDVLYHETRTFRMTWPGNPTGLATGDLRAEITPQVNIFDNNIYKLPDGTSQFDPPPQ